MEPTLVWIGLALIVGGFLVSLYGVWLEVRGLLPYDAGSWTDWVREAVRGMFTALPKALGQHSIGIRLQALGSALTYAGAVFLLLFLNQQFGAGSGDGESPSPSSS